VARHFGGGRFISVFKAALLGIPIPLCSCGVLPAAASLKKQGANNGATTAFLISTPESGIDSMAITYALLDPIMTVARPVVAFVTAAVAGISQNIMGPGKGKPQTAPDLTCTVDACCHGVDCPPEMHNRHHRVAERLWAGFRYAVTELWGDLAGWFFIGLLLAGIITTLMPDELFPKYLGGGLPSMLLMLAVGIPLYICATASTPVAAVLILKGISPGAALVFLISGPATNVTSLTVLWGLLGKRATALYLAVICISTVGFGLALDLFYSSFGFSPRALLGQASEIIPVWGQWAGAILLASISVRPLLRGIRNRFGKRGLNHKTPLPVHPQRSAAETTDLSRTA
jgi:hypothetical protein